MITAYEALELIGTLCEDCSRKHRSSARAVDMLKEHLVEMESTLTRYKSALKLACKDGERLKYKYNGHCCDKEDMLEFYSPDEYLAQADKEAGDAKMP